ncbi:MAG TPA: hypothetical protein VNJ31_01535 [Methyloceanibacter sp.]|nr:hypothetical protein [Methyloceanibacter sp.]
MIGSTPMAGEANWHPVHHANAMLRAALLNSARAAEPPAEGCDAGSLSRAVESVFQDPVSITFPRPLAARLETLTRDEDDAFPAFATLMRQLHRSTHEQENAGDTGLDPAFETGADIRLEMTRHTAPPQLHVQSLLEEFRWRQRQASLLVAGSVVTAALLTLVGLLLIASLSGRAPLANGDGGDPARSTSVVWQPPSFDTGARLQLAAGVLNRAAKAELLAVPDAFNTRENASAPQLQTILATSGRQIVFAPLLPPSQRGYFLIRGLPLAATLSAGRQSNSGAWLVKAEHAAGLTLMIGDAAEGDYPIEIYVLQSGDQPQARRNIMLRVETPSRLRAIADPGKSWTSALLDVVPAASAAEAGAPPADAAALHERAGRLLEEGDIAAARLILRYLAERGESDAAYELARTFDGEMLEELGARGIAADLEYARAWYQRAAQSGNAKASERLKVLASLSGRLKSD